MEKSLFVFFAAVGCCLSLSTTPVVEIRQAPANTTSPTNAAAPGGASQYQNTNLVKGLTGGVALFALLLTASAYYLLIKHSRRVSNGIHLPQGYIEDSISVIISGTWPKDLFSNPAKNSGASLRVFKPVEKENSEVSPYMAATPTTADSYPVMGYDYLHTGVLEHSTELGRAWFSVASPVMRTFVQIAVWQYVSLWLVVAMVANTIFYNGFIYSQPGSDGWVRLILVTVYATATIVHIYYTGILLCQSYTAFARQACWIVLSRHFVFSSEEEHHQWSQGTEVELKLRSFQFELSGELKHSKTLKVTKLGSDGQEEGSDNAAQANAASRSATTSPVHHTQSSDGSESEAFAYIEALRKKDVTALEKAADGCLEKVLANVLILLGVCLAAVLAPWTRSTAASAESTAAQLGSYALLVSLAAGATAMLSSATHLANAAGFMDSLAVYPEGMIRLSIISHRQGFEIMDQTMEKLRDMRYRNMAPRDPSTEGTLIGGKKVTLQDVIRMSVKARRALIVLFGPGIALLPGRSGVGSFGFFKSYVCSESGSNSLGDSGAIKMLEYNPRKGYRIAV